MQTTTLDAYIRVSKVAGREGDSFQSPDDQRERISAWARSRGVTIGAWHEDLDQTGGTLTRPGLDTAMQRIRSRETGGIVVAYVDRLSRAGVADALALIQDIHDNGGQLAALDLGIDPTTPFGEFGMTVLLALGRMQRRRIADGWDSATRRAVARGVHAHPPYGYRKPAPGQPLTIDPGEATIVRRAFELRAAGDSWTTIARWINTQPAPPRRGRQWTRGAVETIIRNRAYLGEASYGRHVNPDAHPPLITSDQWQAAQQARGLRPPRGDPALLAGLVRCAGCRHRMTPAISGPSRQRVYRCKRDHGEGRCPAPASVARALLDDLVERMFLQHYGDLVMESKAADPSLTVARRALQDAETELAAYRDNTRARTALETVGDDAWTTGLERRAQTVVAAREQLEQARRGTVNVNLGSTAPIWPDLTVSERRRLLAEGIDCVMLRRTPVPGRNIGLDPARVKILWRGEAPGDLPGPGRRVPLRSLDF